MIEKTSQVFLSLGENLTLPSVGCFHPSLQLSPIYAHRTMVFSGFVGKNKAREMGAALVVEMLKKEDYL